MARLGAEVEGYPVAKVRLARGRQGARKELPRLLVAVREYGEEGGVSYAATRFLGTAAPRKTHTHPLSARLTSFIVFRAE